MRPFLLASLLAWRAGCATGSASQPVKPEPSGKQFQMRTYYMR